MSWRDRKERSRYFTPIILGDGVFQHHVSHCLLYTFHHYCHRPYVYELFITDNNNIPLIILGLKCLIIRLPTSPLYRVGSSISGWSIHLYIVRPYGLSKLRFLVHCGTTHM